VRLMLDKYIAAKDVEINLIVEDLLGNEYVYSVEIRVGKIESCSPYSIFPNISRFENDSPIEIRHISYVTLKEIKIETSEF